jgi:hypothetical protein
MASRSIKFDIKNRKVFVGGMKKQLEEYVKEASLYRRSIAKDALEVMFRTTPVWSGNTQLSINLSVGTQVFKKNKGKGKGQVGTNKMALGQGEEKFSNRSYVTGLIKRLKTVKNYRKLNSFYITVNSKAADLGVYEGHVPIGPNLHPRVKMHPFKKIVQVMRAKGRI